MSLETGWRHDTPITDTLARRFVFNQADLNDLITGTLGGRSERHPGVALADSAVPVAYLNQAVLLRPVLSADDEVLDVVDDFFAAGSSQALVLSVWPTPDLTSRGWHPVGHPVFVVRSPGPFDFRQPDDVVLRSCETEEDFASAEQVAINGYPLPEATSLPPNALFGASLSGTALRMRLALVDGVPAAIGSGHVAHGVVNLCLAATLPSARRRRAWQSLVWARVNDAPDLPAAAFTSDDSRPGFIRMGFLPICRFTLWFRP